MSDPDQLTDSGHNSLQKPEVDPFMGKIGGWGNNATSRQEVTVKNNVKEVRYKGNDVIFQCDPLKNLY